ncbi:hypothetical protein RHSIM_Rhsim04G0064600 [Rhododendron simsii]|uniref:F-box domain-containing protein n=1 Tax=Rhododendron simsii TaxID=118357 RepID=A0A834H024_RHOSS|nr:hypothetical protein RHSIM_Rhsim04G0064600 [Rhododendron simsii]
MSKKIVSTSSRSNPQLLTSPSPKKHSPAAEIIASNVDLLTEILLRVPAKPLIKFQCVSKHWLSLISDSNFAINHTRRNPTPPVSGIYLHSVWRRTEPLNDQVLPVSVAGHRRTSLPTLSFLDGVLPRSQTSASISSNGLMLFCDRDGSSIVCNLTTQKFIQLPKPSGILPGGYSDYRPYLIFDPTKSPYYKVVLVSSCDRVNALQLAIYTSECASWKNLRLSPSIGYTHLRSAILNGAIIWMTCEHWMGNCSRHEHVYSRLDVDSEELTVTRVPTDPNLSKNVKNILYFGECGGRLLLIQRPSRDATVFSIHEMDRDDFHWIVKDQVDLMSLVLPDKSSCLIYVISIVKGKKENDLAVVFYNRGKVISCNLECRTMKVISELCPAVKDACSALLSFVITVYDGFSYNMFCHWVALDVIVVVDGCVPEHTLIKCHKSCIARLANSLAHEMVFWAMRNTFSGYLKADELPLPCLIEGSGLGVEGSGPCPRKLITPKKWVLAGHLKKQDISSVLSFVDRVELGQEDSRERQVLTWKTGQHVSKSYTVAFGWQTDE